ncbi:NAD-binding protein [Nocardia sp. FBN12]|uniref:NAD-binding protein n=1 Tax=Nocardia sp. FBN12 TaxID=3419766 RepID=UPI003D08871E
MNVPVLAVERDPAAPGLRVIDDLRIPTIVGHGIDRALLDKARVDKATAIAAVGSVERDNLAVAVATHGVAAATRIIIRAGDQDSGGAEIKALLPLGSVCDVTALAVDYIVDRVRRGSSEESVPDEIEFAVAPGLS